MNVENREFLAVGILVLIFSLLTWCLPAPVNERLEKDLEKLKNEKSKIAEIDWDEIDFDDDGDEEEEEDFIMTESWNDDQSQPGSGASIKHKGACKC